ncbi:MAG: hypothetical protein KBD16_03290 [Candidatus Pacebacteria bacterium]|nr:hypothetical protein [Candidatus Paceibacterota bacterium]
MSLFLAILIVIAGFIGGGYTIARHTNENIKPVEVGSDGSDGIQNPSKPIDNNDGSVVALALGESGTFNNVTITPTELVSDSRCPRDVQCIWAGTVEVQATIQSEKETKIKVFRPGDLEIVALSNGGMEVDFLDAFPYPTSASPVPASEYRFQFQFVPIGD